MVTTHEAIVYQRLVFLTQQGAEITLFTRSPGPTDAAPVGVKALPS